MKNNNFNFIFLHVKILTGGIMFKNTLDNKRYYTLNYFFKKKFGQKVFKEKIAQKFFSRIVQFLRKESDKKRKNFVSIHA